jgi:hypothetical protein
VRLQLGDELWCATDALCTSPADNPSLSTTCGGQYRQYVQGIIDTITRLGMVALVDLAYVPALSVHTPTALTCNNAAGQLDQAQGGLTPSQRAMADFAYAPTFWHQLAAQNANNPLVAFDLFNEPDLHNGRPDCGNDSNGQPVHQGRQTIEPASDPNQAGTKPLDVWLNAGLSGTGEAAGRVEDDSGDQQLTDGKMGYQAAGMQLLYNTVRSVAQRNLVFVSGVGVERDDHGVAVDCFENAAYDLSPVLGGWAIAGGTNVVYGTHPYYGSNCSTSASGTSGDGTIPGIPSGFPPNLQGAVYNVAKQYPVAFTEFGSACATDSTAAMFNQGIAADATAPANHIVGWIAHQFVAKYQEQNSDDHTKDGPPFYLFQCLMGKKGDCNLGTNGATQNYQYYEPSQRGQPVYDAIPAAPALR